MAKTKLVWLGKTVLFFALVGGGIGSIFTTSMLSYIWAERGSVYGAGLFLLGYALIGIPVAGFSGLIYAVLRLSTSSINECSWLKRLSLGILSWMTIISTMVLAGFFSEFDRLRGPISYVFFHVSTEPRSIFLLVCTIATLYLHSLAEKAYDFFRPVSTQH